MFVLSINHSYLCNVEALSLLLRILSTGFELNFSFRTCPVSIVQMSEKFTNGGIPTFSNGSLGNYLKILKKSRIQAISAFEINNLS